VHNISKESETPLPLLPVQQIFLEFAPAGLNTLNHIIVLRVKQTPVKGGDLDRLLKAVVRHPILHARFVRRNHSGNGINGVEYRNQQTPPKQRQQL
jgi:hypothetical protein